MYSPVVSSLQSGTTSHRLLTIDDAKNAAGYNADLEDEELDSEEMEKYEEMMKEEEE